MLFVFRRIGIIAITILIANFVLPVVDDQLSFICFRDRRAGFDRGSLSMVHAGGPLITLANYYPSFVFSMRHMNVSFSSFLSSTLATPT
ncbi:MAG TPA: hypothetical protein VMS31_01075 [Pyrinomonadaceae bacterium]|nr:hypothetical protein [Pyrinomonadaceae bacterium]